VISDKIKSLLDVILIPIVFKFEQSDTDSNYLTNKKTDLKATHDEAGIYCKHCHNRITHPSNSIEVNGTHHHVFANPEGHNFEIGVYANAECLVISPAMLEHTWFTGYTWQIVICAECQSHLGWKYTKQGSPAFYGLILKMLVSK